jgi:hypothetical protein
MPGRLTTIEYRYNILHWPIPTSGLACLCAGAWIKHQQAIRLRQVGVALTISIFAIGFLNAAAGN